MPAVIDPSKCNRNFDQCFAARVCPQSAFSQLAAGEVLIDSTLCTDCTGPCLNFCDGYAIRFDRNPDTFDVMRAQLLGEITDEEALEKRKQLAEPLVNDEPTSPVVELTAENFAPEVLESNLPVIVDFWAPWCGPCRAMAPVFERLAVAYSGRVKFAKLDTESQPRVAAQFRITSIPTLMVFHAGELIDGTVGALTEPRLSALVERVLEKIEPLADVSTEASFDA